MKVPETLLFRRRPGLPLIMSSEAAECGLACLAMVAVYHGHDIDLNGLRQRFQISMAGASLRGIMGIADELLLSGRAIRADLGAMEQIRLPAILHWDFNHYVVLKSVGRKSMVIHDPSRGRLEMSWDEVSQHFTGVALELQPAKDFAPVKARAPIRLSTLWPSFRGLRESLAFVLLLSFALQVCAFILPFQMQVIVDDVVAQSDLDLLALVVLAFTVVSVMTVVLTALREWTLQLLGSQIVFQTAGNIFRHLIRLPSDWFEKRHVGDILSRMSAINSIQDVMTQGVVSAMLDGVMALAAGIILFVYAPLLATIVVASLFVIVALTLGFYPVIRLRREEALVAMADQQSHMMESIRAATIVKLMGQESVRESAWRNMYAKSFNSSMSATRVEQTLTFLQGLILTLQTMIIIYIGARNIITANGFSIGMLVAFLSFRQTFTDRTQSLVQKGLQFGMVRLYIERLSDILAQEGEARSGNPVPIAVRGDFSLSGVSFRYGATDRWIFQGIDLDISSGDFIAIIGPTGGGKSTLTKLLLGLQRPVEGAMTLDGKDAQPDLWRAWREQTGVVMQDDRLMSGSLAENIAFFDPDMHMEKVIQAARQAQVHDDIMRMPMTYQTLVGDMGSSLSGGQKQRVLLARALYRSPRVLILDEGTANLDPDTEEMIADMISNMPITRIVVAHRPALIDRATRVMRLENGRLETVR